MAKRWINSVDVEVTPTGALLTDLAGCTTLAGGTKTVPGTPQPPWPSRRRAGSFGQLVWTTTAPAEYYPCFIGDAAGQNIPVMPSNYEGLVIRIDDASKVYVRVVTNNPGVVYRIFA